MGGNALKHLNPTRLTSDEVMGIYWHVVALANFIPTEAHLVPWCTSKQDHGDVDILVEESDVFFQPNDNDKAKCLIAKLPVVETRPNGPVISVGYKMRDGRIAQVDLISVPRSEMRHSRLYYSGSGIGMLLGRVAAWHGFVFAADGFRLRSNPDLPWSRDIKMWPCPSLSLEFLGYKVDDFGAFDTEEDVWKFAMSSKLAKPWMFTSENTNSDNRSRDKGRPGFMRFQSWLAANYDLTPQGEYAKRATWETAKIRAINDDDAIETTIYEQEQEFKKSKERNAAVGMAAVRAVFGDAVTNEQAGEIIRGMQEYLPSKAERDQAFEAGGQEWKLITQLAHMAAYVVGTKLGHPPKP